MPGGNKKGTRRRFGNVRQLPSGRWQATYTGPDKLVHKAPTTFDTKGDADTWLALQSAAITESRWKPPTAASVKLTIPTFAQYAPEWLAKRDLKPRTREEYRKMIGLERDEPSRRKDKRRATTLMDTFGSIRLDQISPELVDDWYAKLDKSAPTQRAHLYALLRTIMGTAVGVPGRRGAWIETNPCTIKGAGKVKRSHRIEPATLKQLDAIAAGVPERWRLLVHLGAWCAPRWGEATELRRRDVDLEAGVLRIRRAVTLVEGEYIVATTKTDAGVRDVAIPPHLVGALQDHLDRHVEPGPDSLLFTAMNPKMDEATGKPVQRHLSNGTFAKHFNPARAAAGRPDLHFHDLRHTGAVFYAQVGATTKELMVRLGHTTPTMAMHYQHAAAGRDAALAAKLSELAQASVSGE